MKYVAQFEQPEEYKMILRDSFEENKYYGLDTFDCKYLKIIQSKFGCINSFHTIPDRVKMEMALYEWNDIKNKFILNDNKRNIIQLNHLEMMVMSYTPSQDLSYYDF